MALEAFRNGDIDLNAALPPYPLRKYS